MKANELRIGNYLEYNGSYPFDGVFDNKLARYLFDVNDEWDIVNPIPLTEEWLKKLGYRKGYGVSNSVIQEEYYESFIVLDKDFQPIDMGLSYKLEYVHQLQNLYFALTSEELTKKT